VLGFYYIEFLVRAGALSPYGSTKLMLVLTSHLFCAPYHFENSSSGAKRKGILCGKKVMLPLLNNVTFRNKATLYPNPQMLIIRSGTFQLSANG
jgi:hypothetical protein